MAPPLVGILSPLTLGQICRTWREIAVSTPSLWRAIGSDLDGDSTRSYTTQLQVLETWLERSSASPLSIALHYYMRHIHADIQPILAALFTHNLRLETMDLFLPFLDMVLLSSRPMPLLCALTLGLSDDDLERTDRVVVFDQAPNLTNVTLHPSFDPFHLILPWWQITTLRGMCLLENELLEIMRLAGNVIHCSVILMKCADDVEMPVITPHMHLQDLTFTPVGLPHSATEMRIFRQLTLPALRSLQIPALWFGPNPGSAIAAWLSRCGCDLEQLHITHSTISEIAYRVALPSVRQLSTEDVPTNTDD
ncbi:hypothetical protein DFH09DRAFT_1189779 [Mycena vulgaris]|nr:hypothetical protein DFH09DRAFT_1189779 [Mycena vulgaris]